MALLRKEDIEVAPPAPATQMGAVLGRGSRFEGKLTFEGTVRIDGEFVGDIVSEGALVVGEGARIEGTVAVSAAVISGTVSGTMRASSTLDLKKTAHVEGDLNVASLTVEKGAFFEGTVKMQGAKEA